MKQSKNQSEFVAPEILCDKSSSGRVRPWEVYKMANKYLAIAYDSIDTKKSERLRACANWLTFRRGENRLVLQRANFCRIRLCPVCQWRRSLKTYGQMRQILAALDGQYKYILLTLTMRNCTRDQLQHSITYLLDAWRHFIGYKRIDEICEGWYRALEVTHNLDTGSLWFDTFHPHLHVIIAVQKSYFTSRKYTTHAEFVRLWKMALHADYDPDVDVCRVKGTDCAAIAEVAKYSVKSSDVIYYDDWDLTVETVRALDRALNGRRMIAMGGVIREMHRSLHLDDSDDGDLVDVGTSDENLSDDELNEITYVWHSGYNQYRRQD